MNKKQIGKSLDTFVAELDDVESFLLEVTNAKVSKKSLTYCHELALIKIYSAYERLMLDCLVTSMNKDLSVLSQQTKVKFPRHLSAEVCEYLIVGSGYFDFKGRDGLIKELKKYLDSSHWLIGVVKDNKYKDAQNQLFALRNFAAHGSSQSRAKAMDAVGVQRLSSAGSWFKRASRAHTMLSKFRQLAAEIRNVAP